MQREREKRTNIKHQPMKLNDKKEQQHKEEKSET